MTDKNHDRAQKLASEASFALKEGREAEAVKLYARAAEYEQKALEALPRTKARTWNILAVSYASLLYKARLFEDAELVLYAFLAQRDLQTFARRQLRELLDVVLDEQALPNGYRYSGDEIVFTLRGSDIGRGTAPFDLVLQKAAEVKNVVARTAELQGEFPFRQSGPPPKEVSDFLQSRATQPIAGSYKFGLKLVEARQLNLLSPPRLRAADVSDRLFQFAKAACSEAPAARDELKRIVPSDDYRRVMLRLLRNVIPTEKGLTEVELSRASITPETSEAPTIETLILPRSTRKVVSEKLREDSPPAEDPTRVVELRGTLRALHLNEHWLVVVLDDGEERHCETPASVLDDVVGPMVNRRVHIRTEEISRTSGRPRTKLLDIDLDED
jgi:hypothetical protein